MHLVRSPGIYSIICACTRFVTFFFFSSRRRHTRLQGDWSSDVCSSDLSPSVPLVEGTSSKPEQATACFSARAVALNAASARWGSFGAGLGALRARRLDQAVRIGRAHVCTPVTL